jgi:hypothetical protein
MGNPVSAIGRFAAKPLAWGQASMTRVLLETADVVAPQARVPSQAGPRLHPLRALAKLLSSFSVARKAANEWANGQSFVFGFLALVCTGAPGLTAGFLLEEAEPISTKVLVGLAGLVAGYVALLAILTIIFWFIGLAKTEATA